MPLKQCKQNKGLPPKRFAADKVSICGFLHVSEAKKVWSLRSGKNINVEFLDNMFAKNWESRPFLFSAALWPASLFGF
jgi:hypothetical protein